ncbi:MAG: hypothetical protein AAF944_09800 [Bacteroidota bacterium]
MRSILVLVLSFLFGIANNAIAQSEKDFHSKKLDLKFGSDGRLKSNLPAKFHLDEISVCIDPNEDELESYAKKYIALADILMDTNEESFYLSNGVTKYEINRISVYYVLLYQIGDRLNKLLDPNICHLLTKPTRDKIKRKVPKLLGYFKNTVQLNELINLLNGGLQESVQASIQQASQKIDSGNFTVGYISNYVDAKKSVDNIIKDVSGNLRNDKSYLLVNNLMPYLDDAARNSLNEAKGIVENEESRQSLQLASIADSLDDETKESIESIVNDFITELTSESVADIQIQKLKAFADDDNKQKIYGIIEKIKADLNNGETKIRNLEDFLETDIASALDTAIMNKMDEVSKSATLIPELTPTKIFTVSGYNSDKEELHSACIKLPSNESTSCQKNNCGTASDPSKILNADSINFQLEQKNRFKQILEKNPPPKELIPIVNSDEFKAFAQAMATDEMKILYKKAKSLLPEDRYDINDISFIVLELKPVVSEYKRLTKSISAVLRDNYFYSFLWFTEGKILASPLDVKFDVEGTQKAISESQEKLTLIKEEIAFYEKMASGGVSTSLYSYNRLKNKRTEVTKTINELQLNLASNQKKSEVLKSALLDTKVMYRGGIYNNKKNYLNKNKTQHAMRQHNALDRHTVMSNSLFKEIPENHQVEVLIHNADPDTDYFLKVTYDKDNDSRSFLETKILDEGVGESIVGGNRDPVTIVEEFVRINNLAEVFSNGVLTTEIINKYSEKEKVKYVSKLAEPKYQEDPFDKNVLNYEITTTIKNKEGEEEDKTLYKGAYRVNKLRRFQLKAGAIYSWLEKTDYDLSEETITVETDNHGLDATFGIQYFIIRQDIRSPRFRLIGRPFLYTGFSFSDSPIKNWYIGGGFEPVNGLAIFGGAHLGESEILRINENQTQIETSTSLVVGPFVSIAFDLNIFKRIFINDTTNPLKP